MNKVRGVLWICFLLIALILVTCGASIWDRAHDPMWSRMQEIRFAYDCISAAVAVSSLAVAYGLWRKREWGRIFGMSLFSIVLFMFVGLPLLAPLLISGGVPITLGWWPVGVGALCFACIVLLSCQRRAGDSDEKPIQT